MVRHSAVMAIIALAIIARRRLRHVAGGDRLPADRGPGLSARRRAAARRRRARPHPGDAAAGGARSPRKRRASTRSSPSPASRRSTTIRRSPMPASPTSCSRTGACAARARTSLRSTRRSTRTLPRSTTGACWCCRRRRSRVSAMPPASPCRSSCATAASISPSCRARSMPWSMRRETQSGIQRVSAPFRANVPQYKVEIDREKVQSLAAHHRPGVPDARQLSRLELCQPVQQVRPRVPDLCAGRRAVPPDAGGDRQL